MPRDALVLHVPWTAIPRLLEVAHVAHRLSISDEGVYRLLRTKQLPAIRLGRRFRVDPVDLEAYIDRCRTAHAKEA